MSIARALTSGSRRSGRWISHAESPAATIRVSMDSAAGARLQRREQALMNVVETAVRHHDHQVAGARLLRHRRDDGLDVRDVARVLARGTHVGDELIDGEP